MKPKISKRKSKIVHNKRNSLLKALRRFEQSDQDFSKRLFAKISPWSFRMCSCAGVPYPPKFEDFEGVSKKKIILAAFSSKIFLTLS